MRTAIKALTDLARHFALLTDVVQITGAATLVEKIARARQRGAQLLQEWLSTNEAREADAPPVP